RHGRRGYPRRSCFLCLWASLTSSSPRPPTPILSRFLSGGIAPLRLRLVVELPTRHVVDASLAGVGSEVALDGLGRRARPRILGQHTGASLIRGFLCLRRL